MSKMFDLFEGPYKVNKRCGLASYEVVNIDNGAVRGRFHASDIQLYIRRSNSLNLV